MASAPSGGGLGLGVIGGIWNAPPTSTPRFWLDEILWSQGRVAVELMEQVFLEAGGVKTGKRLQGQAACRAGISLSAAVARRHAAAQHRAPTRRSRCRRRPAAHQGREHHGRARALRGG
jgi:hypothetical protein